MLSKRKPLVFEFPQAKTDFNMKNHWLRYGTTITSLPNVGLKLKDYLGVDFEERESLYKGVYLNYEGPAFEMLSIQPNQVQDELREPSHPNYKYIIYISLTSESIYFNSEYQGVIYELSNNDPRFILYRLRSDGDIVISG